MKTRYLCRHHFEIFCKNLDKAQREWEHSMAMGLEAVNSRQLNKAERCFGAAYEIASLIFDRQISHNSEADKAANTLLSAQYLATSLVQQDLAPEAALMLKQLHEKFSLECRNPSVEKSLREMLCNQLIPYLEKLHALVLGEYRAAAAKQANSQQGADNRADNVVSIFDAKYSHYRPNQSTLYH